MFCPNCGAENNAGQNYCRTCGLQLNAISRELANQFPSKEHARFERRKTNFEKLGLVSLSVAGLIGVMLLIFKAAYYKLVLFGPDVLFSSAIGALIGFLLLSVFFFNYPRFFMDLKKIDRPSLPLSEHTAAGRTNKLIDDRPFEPVPSVTEHSTELLSTARRNPPASNS